MAATPWQGRAPADFGFENILYRKADGIARVTINRPRVLNALNWATLREMQAAFEDASWDDNVGVLPQLYTQDLHTLAGQLRKLGWEGFSTREVLRQVRVDPEASHVMIHCYGGYTTNLPLEDFLSEHALFVDRHNGEPLAVDHGGHLRLVIPHLYAWKSAKWVNGVELMSEDRRGFWEENGYHTYGDPWKEERFSSQETKEAYQVRRRAKELGILPGG